MCGRVARALLSMGPGSWGAGREGSAAPERGESARLRQSGSDAVAEGSRRAPRPGQAAGAPEYRGLRPSPLPVTSVRHLHGLLP